MELVRKSQANLSVGNTQINETLTIRIGANVRHKSKGKLKSNSKRKPNTKFRSSIYHEWKTIKLTSGLIKRIQF
jgi:protein-disulfide isomerase-like protein with CxxC motif